RHLSAGRVQSVAVRLIVEREREIQNFKPEEFWKITALLAPEGTVKKPVAKAKSKAIARKKKVDGTQPEANGEAPPEVPEGAFLAELAEWGGKKFKASTSAEAQQIVAALEGASYVVAKVEQKDKPEKPHAPFTTSTLQQQASIRLHYSAKKTMMLA